MVPLMLAWKKLTGLKTALTLTLSMGVISTGDDEDTSPLFLPPRLTSSSSVYVKISSMYFLIYIQQVKYWHRIVKDTYIANPHLKVSYYRKISYVVTISFSFFCQDVITLAIVWAIGVSDCWVWLLGLLLGETKDFIWFDFSPSERCTERIFLRPQLPSITLKEDMPPRDKQTHKSLQMICVCARHMGAHVSLYVNDFLTLCGPHLFVCVCVCGWGQICPLAGRCPVHHSWAPATGGVIRAQDFPLAPGGFFFLFLAFSITVCNTHTFINTHMDIDEHKHFAHTKPLQAGSQTVFGAHCPMSLSPAATAASLPYNWWLAPSCDLLSWNTQGSSGQLPPAAENLRQLFELGLPSPLLGGGIHQSVGLQCCQKRW